MSKSSSLDIEDDEKGWAKFIKKFRSSLKQGYNYVSMGEKRSGSYLVEPADMEKYYDKYCLYVHKKINMTMARKFLDMMPVIVDFDLKFLIDILSDIFPDIDIDTVDPSKLKIPKLYSEQFLRAIIQIYQETLLEYTNCTEMNIICILLEKEYAQYKEPNLAHGFHLHFPFATTDIPTQKQVIRNVVNSKIKSRKILEKYLKYQPINKIEDINDSSLPDVTWLEYGSSKGPGKKPYLYTTAFTRIKDVEDLKDGVTDLSVFKPEEHCLVKNNIIDESFFDSGKDPEYYLPLYLGLDAWTDCTIRLKEDMLSIINAPSKHKVKGKKKIIKISPDRKETKEKKRNTDRNKDDDEDNGDEKEKEKKTEISSIISSIIEGKSTKKNREGRGRNKSYSVRDNENLDLDEAEKLVPLLNEERACNHNSWMKVGWCLFNIGGGMESKRSLSLWVKFSEKSDTTKDYDRCEKAWNDMTKGNITLGSMCKWAEEDSPEEYKLYKETSVNSLIFIALSCTNYDIAALLHKLYHNKYRCASIKNKLWYEYKDHRWQMMESASTLRIRMSTELVQRFKKLRAKISNQSLLVEDDDEDKKVDDDIKKLQKVLKSLKTTTFKKSVIEECADLFYEPTFLERLDEDKYLIGTPNGVYDLKEHRLREGSPDDYISLCTKVPYIKYADDAPEMIELNNYLSKVFVNPRIRTYVKRLSGTMLRGGNFLKMALFLIGDGNNSKSRFTDLFKAALGMLVGILQSSVLTGKKGKSNEATGDLNKIKGKLMMFINETKKGDTINGDTLKELTGEYYLAIRRLFNEGEDISNKAKIIISCNKPPKFDSEDHAGLKRINFIPFESTFTSEGVPDSKEEQISEKTFPEDIFFDQKIPEMAKAFLYMLTVEYKKFEEEGLPPCPEVVEVTKSYKKKNDKFIHYFEDRIEEAKESKGVRGSKEEKIDTSEAYDDYVIWFNQKFKSSKPSDFDDFIDAMARITKRKANNVKEYIKGYRLKDDDDGAGDDLMADEFEQ